MFDLALAFLGAGPEALRSSVWSDLYTWLPTLRTVLAFAVGLAYLYALYGLILQLKRVRRSGDKGPQQTLIGLVSNLGRFAGWGAIGALVLSAEMESGLLFLLTRPLGAVLILAVIAHRGNPRISWGSMSLRVGLPTLLYGGTLLGIALLSFDQSVPHWLSYVLYGTVYVFFALAGFSLIYEIWEARSNGTHRKGRNFQYGMLFNFLLSFLYGLTSEVEGLAWLMILAYGMMTILQLIFCMQIYVGRRRYLTRRAERKASKN